MSCQELSFFPNKLFDPGTDIFSPQHLTAHGVNSLAVPVHNIVILNDVFTHIEVKALNLLVGAFQALADHTAFNRRVIINPQTVHDRGYSVAAINAHQVVLAGNIKLGDTRIALAAGTAAQLVVDTARFVALTTQNE